MKPPGAKPKSVASKPRKTVKPSAVFVVPRPGTGLGSLTPRLNAAVKRIAPSKGGNYKLFGRYSADKKGSLWARGWTRNVDMTGVGWNHRWAGVLVSPRHILMARHASRNVGSRVVFTDRQGDSHSRLLINKLNFPKAKGDVCVGLLDRPAPVRFYKVPAPRDDYHKILRGAHVFVTNKIREMHIHEIAAVSGRSVVFTKAHGLPPTSYKRLVNGDSGNPSFLLVNGDPILIETHTTGGPGAGPFFGNPEVAATINSLMSKLGGGHQLTYARLR